MKNRKYVFVYFTHKRLCCNAGEAVEFVNSLSLGRNQLRCNPTCKRLIEALFLGDIHYYQTGYISGISHNGEMIPGFHDIATTGCSTTRIKFYPALADTLDQHQAIYLERQVQEASARHQEIEARARARMSSLTEMRKGYYHVLIEGIRVDGFRTRGNDHPKWKDFSGIVLADSGADAYAKAASHLEATMLEDTCNNNFTYAGHFLPAMTSNNYSFEFLGVKTDDGYSIDLWQQWKDNGI